MRQTTKRIALIMVMTVLLQALLCIPAFAASDAQVATNATEARETVVQINLMYTHEDGTEWQLKGESGFFIDSSYVLTCYHGLNLTDSEINTLSLVFGDYFRNNYKNKLKIELVLQRDVKVTATLTEAKSESYDFAVLKLNTSLNGSKILALGSDDMVSDTMKIHCLGFPSITTGWEESHLYKPEDVTITTGNVGKTTSIDGTSVFMHTATVNNGNSGGPTIDDNGVVLGMVKAVATQDSNYSYSVFIDDIKSILDRFGIPYVNANSGSSTAGNSGSSTGAVCNHEWGTAEMKNCVPTYTCALCGDTKEDAAQHTFGEWTVSVEAKAGVAGLEKRTCAICGKEETRDIPALEKSEFNWLLIVIIVAAVVVVAVVVVIIVIATSGKKQVAPVQHNIPNAAPQVPVGVGAPARPPVAPQVPPVVNNPAPHFVPPVDEGAGNTTVLNEGAGETTVLGGGAVASSCSLLRVKNGEKITVAASEFIIGKEKRRVNYCISDNNSISRTHAKIIARGNSHYIVDMNSTNFTFVNGIKLSAGQEQLLNDGDKIKFSDEEFEFKA